MKVFATLCATLSAMCLSIPAAPSRTVLKSESFDRDPAWEAHNNRIVPKAGVKVAQDFGYSPTHYAGKAGGEMGGKIQRSTTPASYAAKISNKTLDDNLSASGSFAITATQAGAGVFFGYFNSVQPGGSGRPIGSLGMNFDFEQTGGRLAVRLITSENQSCGTFITRFEHYRTPEEQKEKRPTPLRNDGTRYHWKMNYDPKANNGDGQFTFVVTGDSAKKEDFDGKTFTVDLPPGYRKQGATFDRFGVMNMMKAGGTVTMYFDDLVVDGKAQDFSSDPKWSETGNRASFEDFEQVGAHDFGFSAKTSIAGGKAGEAGGSFWRSGAYGYYADRVGRLTLEHRLEARGKVKLVTAGPDSDLHIGWFSSTTRTNPPIEAGNFVGVHIGGPTRIGHYFIPVFTTAKGSKGKVDQGPILRVNKEFEWSLIYDPTANGGLGEMQVTLGSETVKLPLKPGQKAQGAQMDRFGLMTNDAGGQMVKIYFDDLKYTIEETR